MSVATVPALRPIADATAANVTLHVMIDSRDGRLSGRKLRAAVPD